jgi:nicotinamide riboside kinase
MSHAALPACGPTQGLPPKAGGEPLLIAVLGAESTGKTWLAQALSERLAQTTGLRCVWVPEWLRQWCEITGRTPEQHEQTLIAQTQHARIDAASQAHDIVVADTTGLMTAVYSLQVFGDDSLRESALALHRSMHLTLLTALDLPWVADGHQRDGPHVREPVDATIHQWLTQAQLPFVRVSGLGAARLACAARACEEALSGLLPRPSRRAAPPVAQFTASEPGG